MDFRIIAALDEEDGIGCGGQLPWKIPSELKFFKEKTTSGISNAIIMGRKTWDSLHGWPLPNRLNIVLSFSLEPAPGYNVSRSLDEALNYCYLLRISEVWVIGGGDVYSQAIFHPGCVGLMLSRVHQVYSCDTKFPKIPERYRLTYTVRHSTDNWSSECYELTTDVQGSLITKD